MFFVLFVSSFSSNLLNLLNACWQQQMMVVKESHSSLVLESVMQEMTHERVSEHLNILYLCFERCTGLYWRLLGGSVDGWLLSCYFRHRTIIKHFNIGLLNRRRIKNPKNLSEFLMPLFAFLCTSFLSDFNFTGSLIFLLSFLPGFLGLLWLIWKQFFPVLEFS